MSIVDARPFCKITIMTTEPRDPAGLNEPDEANCGEEAERASPPTPSSDGGLAAIAAASADPGGHQAAGSETAGGEDTASPRHAGERNDERRSNLGVGPPISQAPATSPKHRFCRGGRLDNC